MAKVELTIQEALAKKKILEDRVNKNYISTQKFAFVAIASETDTTIQGVDREEAIKIMKSNFDSTRHLISNLRALKSAINASNAITKVMIAGKEYTVADAIAKLQSIKYDKKLLEKCEMQLLTAKKEVEKHNASVSEPDALSMYVNRILGSSESAKKNETLYNTIVDDYMKKNLVYLIDPNDLQHMLESYMDDVNQFEEQVHTALLKSNLETIIEVEFED